MTERGTAAYDGIDDLPSLVRATVELARATGFPYSCLPEQGALLRLLAGGVGPGKIGETGQPGCGTGLAWLARAARTVFRAPSEIGRASTSAPATGGRAG